MDHNTPKPPVRQIDWEFIKDLELVSNKCFPLPGADVIKNNYSDQRIKVQNIPGLQLTDKISLYEHIATVRHTKSDAFLRCFPSNYGLFIY